MDYIKQHLAPCGLNCGKCFAYSEGDIKKSSRDLHINLGNFELYAQRFVELLDQPVFKNYPAFKELLTYFTTVECGGCRKEKCKLFKNCNVRECHVKKNVDFCFQCSEFPCNNTGFDGNLYKRSMAINLQMKEMGVGKYYEKVKDQPRY